LKLLAGTEDLLAYERRLGGERFIVALNMSGQACTLRLGEPVGEIVLSTYLDDRAGLNDEEIHLRADEGLILRGLTDVS
jgi:alpha-glucosidase